MFWSEHKNQLCEYLHEFNKRFILLLSAVILLSGQFTLLFISGKNMCDVSFIAYFLGFTVSGHI